MKTPDPAIAMMQKAVAFHKQGQPNEAEQAYHEVLTSYPDHIDALRLLGGLYMQSNRAGDAIECYEKALAFAPTHPELLTNLGVALYGRGRREEAAQKYKQAIESNPNYWDAAHNLGNLYADSGVRDEATLWLRRALDLKPDHIPTLLRLGNLLREAGQSAEAVEIYRRLARLQPNNFDIHNNLGAIYHDLGKWAEAMEQFEAALKLQPDNVSALINRAGLLIELDNPQEARAGYERILELKPDLAEAKWGKSLAHLMLGEYAEGWALYESRFGLPAMRQAAPFQKARWDGGDLTGKRLLIRGEQGFGDILQFIRYAQLCKEKGATVIVQCPRPLIRLLANCPFIDEVVEKAEEKTFDFQVPVMSLPRLFQTTLETIPAHIPYLFVSEDARQKWAPHFAGKEGLKIGLVWAGNPRKAHIDAHVTDRQRSLSLAQLQPLLDTPGCSFYSLQKDAASAEIKANGLEGKIINLMDGVVDFMDTAAIIENLDLVISVDTSVVHLAGGLGKPVWVLSRFGGCWRWLRNKEVNPWYPTARIFAPNKPGDWKSCIKNVSDQLKSFSEKA